MGGNKGSSSKRKSSKRKRDKTSSKKKSRRKESKKRRRIHDSASSSSDDDSLNSVHSSSAASESDHRRRINENKKRLRGVSSYSDDHSTSSDSDSGFKRRKVRKSRISSKITKKRARKRSASPKRDANAKSVRKTKRLDSVRVVKTTKKSSKTKPKKHLSCSSSSDSESCSTCQSRSSGSTADGKHRRGKLVRDKEVKRSRGRESYNAHKKHKVSSLSGRDSGRSVSVSHGDEVALYPVNNPRRLRSVIAVVHQSHNEGEDRWDGDPQKEEIVYDQNDYPSPKSVDSNEGESKIEIDNHSYDAFGKKIRVEDVVGEGVTELTKSRTDESKDNHLPEVAHMINLEKEKEKDVSVPVAALGAEDLESILRQKALENLRKFKGRIQTGPEMTDPKMNETDVNRSSAGRVDIFLNKSTNQDSPNGREMSEKIEPSLKTDFSQPTEDKNLPDSEHIEKEPTNDNGPEAGATNAYSSSTAVPSSSVGLVSGENSLEQKGEANDGSGFEQKTMSVMRGGEMVQVSYKVYIPKKAPALARRHLRR